MQAYRMIPCQMCGADDGTVVGAHSNQSKHGKGRGIKASDVYCASLCSLCHHQIDQGFLYTQEIKRDLWDEAHKKTMRTLEALELWPSEINKPELI